jgi:signal transduction histidine kinase
MASISRVGAGDSPELDRALDNVDDAIAGVSLPSVPRRLARTRAAVLYRASGDNPDVIPVAQLSYAGELLLLIAVDLAAEPTHAQRLIEQLEVRGGVPRLALGREVLQSARLLASPASLAIEVRLALLRAFAGATSVTLWTLPGQQIQLVGEAGPAGSEQGAIRELAHNLLAVDGGAPPPRGAVTGVRLERLRLPRAALILERPLATAEQSELLLGAGAPAVSALLDRQAMTVRDSPHQQAVLGSVERRLARLRFDLHDGPQQDVHLLAQDLALFRDQLRPAISRDPNANRLLGRLDDLEAQLVALDGDLRRLSTAVQSPLLIPGSLPEAVRSVTDSFATRTAIVPTMNFSGHLDELTDSQQIALLSLIREALSNIRQHSEAEHVEITVAAGDDGVRVEIRDDGKGFDLEETLVKAARAGRLGLVGMHERVRMLGGVTRIDSQPGTGTVISATLPPWPGQDEPPAEP